MAAQERYGDPKAVLEAAEKAGLKINTAKVPERYAFAWFEEATKQDEPEIQALFARLLVRASEGDKDALDRRHVATFGQFTPIDAAIFQELFYAKEQSWPTWAFGPQFPRWEHEPTVRRLDRIHGETAGASVEHLINLGVLARGFQLKATPSRNDLRGLGSQAISTIAVKNELIVTALGWSLQMALKEKSGE